MFIRIGPPRAGRDRIARRARWLVVPLLVALAFSLLETSVAAAAIPSRTGPEGLPPVPPTIGPLIVGGTDVPDGKYQFQAALLIEPAGTNDFERQYCGGSLISPFQVLTAAHCVDFFGPEPGQPPLADLRVVVGRTLLTSTQGQRRSVEEIAIHPNWQPTTFRYDAAVITLSEPILGVRPILLNPGFVALERRDTSVIATGWGNMLAQPVGTGGGEVSYPDRMREVTVPIVSPQECATALTIDGIQYFDRDTMLCAGRTGKDTCQGDSGGPLFAKAGTDKYIQIGITSWGVGCAATGFPGVYTKLSNRSILKFIVTAAVSGVL